MSSRLVASVSLFCLLAWGCVWGQTISSPTPTPKPLGATPSASLPTQGSASVGESLSEVRNEPEKAFTPTIGEKVNLQDWVVVASPTPVRPEDLRYKQGVWLSLISVGAGIPLSSHLQEAYSTAFHLGLGMGLKVSDPLSLWIDFNLDQFNNKNAGLTNNNNYMLIGLAGIVRYRILTGPLSPFVLLGPGLTYNEDRSTIPLVDTTYQTVTVPINGSEVDFLLEGGLGLSFKALNGMEIFVQGRGLWAMTSPRFANVAYTDSPVNLFPLETGLIVSY